MAPVEASNQSFGILPELALLQSWALAANYQPVFPYGQYSP
jgi:hypothetical protein